MTIRVNWRPAVQEDVPACLRVSPAISGEGVLGRSESYRVWKELTTHAAFQSAVVETERPVLGSRVVGFGASVFVQNTFARDEMEHPRPGVTERILRGIAEGRPALLSQIEIKQNNTINGLNVIMLTANVRPDVAGQTALTERVQPLLANAFLACQSGYRLRRILLEIDNALLRRRVDEMRLWQIREHGLSQGGATDYGGALAFMERSDALLQRESLSAMLFNYQEPRLRLTTAEQELLQTALTGRPDREISMNLGISKETIKTRWLSALRKAEDTLPDIFPNDEDHGIAGRNGNAGRGPQRRHHLMQFLRTHPEELRPFDWSRGSKS